MIDKIKRWLNAIPLSDEVEHRQSVILQLVLIVWIAMASVGMPATWIPALLQPPPPSTEPIPPIFFLIFIMLLLAGLLIWASPCVALFILRRGRFRSAVTVASLGFLTAHSIAAYFLGVADASVAVMYQIPLVLSGLLGGRRLLFSVAALNILLYISIGILQSQTPPLAGLFSSGAASAIPSAVGFFVAVTVLLTVLLERFGSTLGDALKRSHEREADLQAVRTSLENRVAERTAALQQALDEVQLRADEQAQLLHQIDLQQATIRDLSIPVIPVDDHTLVMPLVGTLDNARLVYLQTQGLEAIERTRARTLILDITGVPIVDTQVAQGILMMAQSVRLLGADVVLVGVRPEVAQTIVGLGIDLRNMRTFSGLQAALSSTHQVRQPSNRTFA